MCESRNDGLPVQGCMHRLRAASGSYDALVREYREAVAAGLKDQAERAKSPLIKELLLAKSSLTFPR